MGAVDSDPHQPTEKLNCFTQRMIEEVRHALDAVADTAKGVRCLMITGAGRGFCSGQDLAEAMAGSSNGAMPDLGDVVEKSYTPMIKSMRELEMPVLGAINGIAAGAGTGSRAGLRHRGRGPFGELPVALCQASAWLPMAAPPGRFPAWSGTPARWR